MNDLVTDDSFPVDYGTNVSVKCRGNLEILGDREITCVKDLNYEYKIRPQCVSAGKYDQIHLSPDHSLDNVMKNMQEFNGVLN